MIYWIPVISDRNRSWHVKSFFFFLVFLWVVPYHSILLTWLLHIRKLACIFISSSSVRVFLSDSYFYDNEESYLFWTPCCYADMLVYLFFLLNTDANKSTTCSKLLGQLTLWTCASVLGHPLHISFFERSITLTFSAAKLVQAVFLQVPVPYFLNFFKNFSACCSYIKLFQAEWNNSLIPCLSYFPCQLWEHRKK